jgi:hypothetical protein
MSKISSFAIDVLSAFPSEVEHSSITDDVFITIQNNENYMHRYSQLVSEYGVGVVNWNIGKKIKRYYNLSNDIRCNLPKSTLIQSYQEFE